MKRAVRILGFVFALTSLTTTGCWDRLEIEDRGAVLGLAIDPAMKGAENVTGPFAKSNVVGYRLTVQIAIPGRIPLGPGEGTSGGGKEKPVWVVSTTGKTIDGAMNNLQQELADKVFLGHLRIIIVNRALAQSPGLQDIQDFLRRNAEIRRLAWLMVSDGDAEEALQAVPKLERVPILYLVGTMDHAVQLGKLPNVFLGNYWSVLSSKGQEPVLPLIAVEGKDRIQTEGLAIFRGYRMVGTMDPLETAAFMEIMNQHRAGYGVAIPLPGDPNHSVIIKGTNRREKIKIRLVKGHLVSDMYSRIEANIEEATGTSPVQQKIPQVAEETASLLTQNQQALIAKTKELGTDVFGLGEYVRGQLPGYWLHNVQTRERWDEMYRNIPVNVHVKVYMRRAGMSAR